MNQPIDILVELLKKWDIQNVISIDDGWIIDNSADVRYIHNLLLENFLDIESMYASTIDNFEVPSLVEEVIKTTDLDDFITLYHDLTTSDKEALERIISSAKPIESFNFIAHEESLYSLARILNQLLEKGFNVRNACEYGTPLRQTLNGKTLWLLDKEINGNDTQVFETLETIIDKEDVALIITNDDSNLSSRIQIKSFVQENSEKHKNLETSFLWVLRKDKIDSDLLISVKNVLQGVTIHSTLKIYDQLNELAQKESASVLKYLEPDDLENFFRSSFSEGSRLSDTLLRIQQAVTLKSFHEMILKEPHYIENLLRNRELLEVIQSQKIIKDSEQDISVGTEMVAATRNNIFLELDQNNKVVPIHSYEHWDYNVNLLGSSVYTGDLFVKTAYNQRHNKWTIGKKVYLLVTQPCDTVLRVTNGKVQRGTKSANLIKGEFYAYGTANYSRVVVKEIQNKIKIHFVKINNEYGMIEFDLKNIHQIDFRILDLSSLDNNGEALLRIENLDRSRFMSSVSKEYYETDLKAFIEELNCTNNQDVDSQFKKFVNGQINIEDLKNSINKVVQKASIKNKVIVPDEVEFIHEKGFSLTRVARLNDEYILNVIKQSTEYQGRQALPGLML